jgi:3-hydroxyisobutyrate dehydrogenase-like beta-hydroxyacid dehydrogenase
MSEITVIGLGPMGSALARALLQANHQVTVWNRTAAKMAPLLAIGANGATSVATAVQASPLVVICIGNYGIAKSLLGANEVSSHLSGRTLIQLSTGTPREARESEIWARDHGADYIDGAIMVYPDKIGRADTLILLAGAQAVFDRCRPYLERLGGDIRHVGINVGMAAALDLAILSKNLGVFMGAIHGARICESEGVGVDLFASLLANNDRAKTPLQTIHAGAYENPGATINVWEAVLHRIQQQADDAQINREVPDFVSGIFKRAIAAGHGKEDVAALIKVLRGNGGA